MYDLCDLESAGFSVVANQLVKGSIFSMKEKVSIDYTRCCAFVIFYSIIKYPFIIVLYFLEQFPFLKILIASFSRPLRTSKLFGGK